MVIELVLGEGGFVVGAGGVSSRALAEICRRHGILLVADEIQTGFGRTGKMWASEHYGLEADLFVTAKSLAGGLPLSAVTGRAEMMDASQVGGLGGTYVGNPVACAAALAVLDLFETTRSGRARGARSASSARGALRGDGRAPSRRSATRAAWAPCGRSSWCKTAPTRSPTRSARPARSGAPTRAVCC